MHNASFSDLNQSWSHLAATVAAAPGLDYMNPHLEELRQALEEAREAEQRQIAHRAAAQQATRDLEKAKHRAHEAAVCLRSGLWGHYGRTGKELIAFGLRPYPTVRTRKATGKPSPRVVGSAGNVGEPFPNAPAPARDEGKPVPGAVGEPSLQEETPRNVGERLPNVTGPLFSKGRAQKARTPREAPRVRVKEELVVPRLPAREAAAEAAS